MEITKPISSTYQIDKSAIKVINHDGDEVLKVFEVWGVKVLVVK